MKQEQDSTEKIFVNKIGIKLNDINYIYCKKDTPDKNFKEGTWYYFKGVFGDPEGSIESGEKYLSSTFFNYVLLLHDDNKYLFPWKGKNLNYVKPYSVGIVMDEYAQDHFIFEKEKLKKLL